MDSQAMELNRGDVPVNFKSQCPCGKPGEALVIVGNAVVRCPDCAEVLYSRIAEGR